MGRQTKPTEMGMNRTGIATSPIDIKEMLEGADAGGTLTPDGHAFEEAHLTWARQASPVGTMPPPASLRGAAKATIDLVQGKKTNVLLDLLGERLAFERTGTRLYECLLVKLAAANEHPGGPTRAELERIHDEELAHLALLKTAIEQLGADPTVVTPSADIVGVAAQGWVQALGDPRVTLTEGLKVILQAELVDNESWTTLAELASALGHDELVKQFREALVDEEEHLSLVRQWVNAALAGQAGASVDAG
jgi:rubrerythrin